jgi:hypothetical protein
MRSMPADLTPDARSRYRRAATVALFFIAALALLVARAMTREVSRDEEQFVSAGALLLREGALPYVDYPYFHVPNLAFVYAALFAASDHLLLAARSFNVLCGWLTLMVVFAVAAREFRNADRARLWIAGAAAAALLASPLFRLTSGSAWNHDLAVLCAIAGFAALLRANDAVAPRRWVAVSAALLGVAIGTRLSFLPSIVPFAFIAAVTGSTPRERLLRTALFSSVLVLSLTPTLVLCARAPAQFFFDNFVYNGSLNRAYRIASGNSGVQLSSKLLFIVSLLKFPHTVVLLIAFVFLAVWLPMRNGWRGFTRQRSIFAVVACLPFLAIGAFAPSPSYKQYYYALVPFLVLGCVFGLARVWRNDERTRDSLVPAGALVCVSAIALAIDLPLLRKLAAPGEWPVTRVHELGRDVRAFTAGPVLTLSPTIPLEGGADIYKEFATGLFAWRTAEFLPDEPKPPVTMVGAATLDAFLAGAPPAAIITRRRNADRQRPLSAYAESHGYRRVLLRDDLELWLRGP